MEKLSPTTESILSERYGKDGIIALATCADGKPSVRYVNSFYENGSFYVLTYTLSGKIRQIADNPEAAVAAEWFTAHGKGVNLGAFSRKENAPIAEKMKTVFAAWLDNGHSNLEDENTCILQIRLTDGVLLDHGTRHEIDFTDLL